MTRQTLLWHHARGDNDTMHHTMTPADAWVAPAIGELGGDAFHISLLQGLHAALGVDHLSYLRYDRAGCIRQAASASLQDPMLIESTTDLYVNRLYGRDPHYTLLCNDGHAAGPAVRMLATAPAGIRDAEYRRLLFEKPASSASCRCWATGATAPATSTCTSRGRHPRDPARPRCCSATVRR